MRFEELLKALADISAAIREQTTEIKAMSAGLEETCVIANAMFGDDRVAETLGEICAELRCRRP